MQCLTFGLCSLKVAVRHSAQRRSTEPKCVPIIDDLSMLPAIISSLSSPSVSDPAISRAQCATYGTTRSGAGPGKECVWADVKRDYAVSDREGWAGADAVGRPRDAQSSAAGGDTLWEDNGERINRSGGWHVRHYEGGAVCWRRVARLTARLCVLFNPPFLTGRNNTFSACRHVQGLDSQQFR